MLAWIWRVSEQVQQLANQDPEYQKFTAQRAELDQAFTDLLDRLSEADRELLLEIQRADQHAAAIRRCKGGELHRCGCVAGHGGGVQRGYGGPHW